jgi:hypothetical protein
VIRRSQTAARARRRVMAVAACAVGLPCGLAGVARADISAAQVIDGPANAIVDVDGAALAADGSGGVVYRKEIDGVMHVFAVPVSHGTWGAPVEVDGEDLYGASQPAIAAADHGRLLVVWVQPRAVTDKGITLYELMSASMGPGGGGFGPPIIVDPNVGEPYTGDAGHVDPSLAMASGGDAYVVYRVVDDDCEIQGADLDQGNPFDAECPQTYSRTPTAAVVEVRVARFAQGPWSSLGEINRAPQIAMRPPSASNEPAIAIGDTKAGLVVWQEPDATGVARIFARRLFGTTPGNVIELSPTTINGEPVGADADSPAAGFDDTGLATAAFRLQGGVGSPLGSAELMSQVVPASEAQITPALNVAGGAEIGPPSLAEDEDGDERIAYTDGGEAFATDSTAEHPAALGSAAGAAALTTVDPDGGGVTAWPSADPTGLPLVDVDDAFPGGGSQFARLVGGLPGPITGLSLGSDGAGDAIIAWMQGPVGDSEVVGDVVNVAPHTFTVQVPTGWQSSAHAGVSWNPAAATTQVTYSVYVDGRPVLQDIPGPTATAPATNRNFPSRPVSPTGEAATITRRLPLAGLGSGVHEIQVLATDGLGQTMMSAEHSLKLDVTPPIVQLSTIERHHGVHVSVTDPDSGVAVAKTRIDFGDGSRVSSGQAQVDHTYAAPGLYEVTAHVVDKVGNAATLNLGVRVR